MNFTFGGQLTAKFDSRWSRSHNGRIARQQPYAIRYDRATKRQLRAIEVKCHSLIRAAIEGQLPFEPAREARSREPLRQPAPFAATWEPRFGPGNRFRVLYGIDDAKREVQVQAIGMKVGIRLLVAGEEVDL